MYKIRLLAHVKVNGWTYSKGVVADFAPALKRRLVRDALAEYVTPELAKRDSDAGHNLPAA